MLAVSAEGPKGPSRNPDRGTVDRRALGGYDSSYKRGGIMQAQVSEEGEVTVVRLIGRLDIEAAAPFRDACRTRLAGKPVVLDFRELSFVGSNGIVPFLESVRWLAQEGATAIGFSGVGSEFRRVLTATSLARVEIFETFAQAASALEHRPRISAAPAPTHDDAEFARAQDGEPPSVFLEIAPSPAAAGDAFRTDD